MNIHVIRDKRGENHGEMIWTGEFDEDHYAIFACARCSRRIGFRPGSSKYRCYDKGLFELDEHGTIVIGTHRAVMHPGLFDVADIEERWGTIVAPEVFDRMESDPEFAEQMAEFARSFKIEVDIEAG